MMASTPSIAASSPSPVITSTPVARDIATASWPLLAEHVDDVPADPAGGSGDGDPLA